MFFYKKEDDLIGGLLDDRRKILQDDQRRAEHMFNKIFSEQGDNSDPPPQHLTKHGDKPTCICQLNQLNSTISMDEIERAIAKLKTSKKSADSDNIHPKMLKQGSNFFLIALRCLFKQGHDHQYMAMEYIKPGYLSEETG